MIGEREEIVNSVGESLQSTDGVIKHATERLFPEVQWSSDDTLSTIGLRSWLVESEASAKLDRQGRKTLEFII